MKFRLLLVWMLGTMIMTACGGASETTVEPQATDVPVVESEPSEIADESDTGSEEMSGEDHGLPMVDPLDITGDIVTAGSSTVFPLSERMAERFTDEGYGGQITVDSIGTDLLHR